MRMIGVPALMFLILASGCGNDPESPENKRIYSVLQYQSSELRRSDNRLPYVFTSRALDTEINTIAFPRSANAEGYVVFFAEPEAGGLILSVPGKSGDSGDFVLKEETLDEIVEKGLISTSLATHLASHIN